MEKVQGKGDERRLSLSTRILIGLAAGIGCGLFFGEYCGWLGIAGQAFIDLLQMTILPYITVSLILNIGRLSGGEARRLARVAGAVLLLLWAIAVAVLMVAPQVFPELRMGSFFSPALLDEPPSFDILGLYIPANPFHSLANAVVPAVVVFSIFLGTALIGVEGKQKLLDMLDVVSRSLARVNSFVIRLAPYGMFAIAASAAGTLTIDEMGRLEGYLLAYTMAGAVLAFWALPALVAIATPFSYRQVVGVSRDAMMTAFATGKLFVVLPLVIEACVQLYREAGLDEKVARERAGILVPLAYPFPTVGKLLGLLFLPFAAWFAGSPMTLGQYPLLISTGLVTFFGSPLAAVPFLLDLFRLPADVFHLFVMSGVWTTRISDLVGTMHLLVFAVLTSCAMAGMIRIRTRRAAMALAATIIIAGVAVVGLRSHLAQGGEIGGGAPDLAGMRLLGQPVAHSILESAEPNPVPLESGQSRLVRIRNQGVIRIGFNSDELPFAFMNGDGELVGFDIDMAHRLARTLEVAIDFVPFTPATLAEQLGGDHFDVAMSGVFADFRRLENSLYADSGVRLHGALVVPDHLRAAVASIDAIAAIDRPRFATVGQPKLPERFFERFPDAELVRLDDYGDFFEGRADGVMALLTTAEVGSAWTVRHPGFQVVIPEGVRIEAPLVYPIAQRDTALRAYIERWAVLVAGEGTVDDLYQHWILGRGASPQRPRWSVIRDVLGWVE